MTTLVTPSIRPFQEQDYPAVLAVWNAVYADYPWSVEAARHEDSRYDGTRLHLRRFVAEAEDAVVGVTEFHHVANMYHPHKFWTGLDVHPAWQGRGIGSALYDRLLRELVPYRPQVLWVNVRETFRRSLPFAGHRGFREVRRAWESRLDVNRFDPVPFRADADRGSRGLAIVTVASEQTGDAEWLQKLYELHTEVAADIPQPEPYTPMTIEEFRRRWFENHPEYLPEGHFLAKHEGRYVAESNLFRSAELDDVLYQGITGTRRAYRGRGVALALKLHTIAYARARGKREIRTWNDTLNAPMLAINTRLGFVRQPAWITFEKTF
ncbi:MAG TPA: GNAT family N-acetyltransferase [bacterium]|nr:GNAT family N-acetyltransferase [bacterium]